MRKKKLLLVGAGPLPDDDDNIASAAGLRTLQFLNGLEGVEDVTLVVVENSESNDIKRFQRAINIRQIVVGKNNPRLFRIVKEEIKQRKPDVVIGINTFPAYVAASAIDKSTPFWADLNGWALAEVQAQAFARDTDIPLWQARQMESVIVKRADKISAVSTAQKHAIYGEMALLGRLTKDTFCYPFVEVVENSCRPLSAVESQSPERVFRGKSVPHDAILLLWLGGFNAWADEATLFAGMEKTITADPNIHLMITGGALIGIDEKTFYAFQQRVEKSKIKGHIHFCGWLPVASLRALLHEVDAGLNVDLPCAETMMGARNRLNEMLRFGIPILTTEGSEIAAILDEAGAALTCPSQDADILAEKILHLAQNIDVRKRLVDCQQTLIKKRFYATIVQKPVIQWLSNTQCAPNRHQHKQFGIMGLPLSGIVYLRNHGVRAFLRKAKQYVIRKIG